MSYGQYMPPPPAVKPPPRALSANQLIEKELDQYTEADVKLMSPERMMGLNGITAWKVYRILGKVLRKDIDDVGAANLLKYVEKAMVMLGMEKETTESRTIEIHLGPTASVKKIEGTVIEIGGK